MPLDVDTIRRGCRGDRIEEADHLCGAEIERFRSAVQSGEPLTVGCTQQAPLFGQVAGSATPDMVFVNIRETAGWSGEALSAAPKMAALIAAASEPVEPTPLVSLESEGVVLVYGRDEQAIEAGFLLQEQLDVTVLLTNPGEVAPPRVTEFPVVKGTIRSAKGHLGAFEVTVDAFAVTHPSSRGTLRFGSARDGAVSRCDIVLDLSGGAALFPSSDLRDGYLRADPGDSASVLRAVMRARDLVGQFDKPRYIAFTDDLCAHSRSRIVGCQRCLDLCPTGAIAPAGDHVAIDVNICAGCGSCAAVCPTGAAAYALPATDALMRKLQTLLAVYRQLGGSTPIILVHDESHGFPLIHALSHHGEGLPAHVLPLAVNEVAQVGLEVIAAAFAYGAAGIRFLLRARPRDMTGLARTLSLAEPILAGLGFGRDRLGTIETDDPFDLGSTLTAIEPHPSVADPAGFRPVGRKRDVLRLAMRELHRVAPVPTDVIGLPPGAPFGTLEVAVEGCTLCLACVSACPTGALIDDPERPMLKFAEDACVQCGLCQATCPEKVITLRPQLDFRAATAPARLIKQEEPFRCIRCGKPFGTRSSVERVTAKLEGHHWMYRGPQSRLDLIKMCEDCRVIAVTERGFDPYAAPERPAPRTSEDYLREREGKS